MMIVAYFASYGTPALLLAPTLNIREVATGVLVVNGDVMTEIGDGFYKYSFAGYDATKNYVVAADGGAGLAGGERYSVAGFGFILTSGTAVAYFSFSGTPALLLTPTIDVWEVGAAALVVAGAAMTEVGDGFYRYIYAGYDVTKEYAFLCNGGAGLLGAERYSLGTTAGKIFSLVDGLDLSVDVSGEIAVGVEVDNPIEVNVEVV